MTMPATPARIAGKRGLARASQAPHLLLSNFRTPPPPPPSTGDVTMGLEQYGMLGNGPTPANTPEYPTGLGDCGPAATEHGRMLKALLSVTGGDPHYEPTFRPPHTPYTRRLYFAYGKAMGEGTDATGGVTNHTWLQWCYEEKLIEWYGQLNAGDMDEVHQGMLDMKGVLVAVDLTTTADTDFENHQPWHLVTGPPDHDVLLCRYTPNDFTVVTWGGLQVATGPIKEAWLYGTKEDAERAGYDYAAIVAAIEAYGPLSTFQPA